MDSENHEHNDCVKELRKRADEQGNALITLKGEMLADRMVAEERHRNHSASQSDIKNELLLINGLIARLSSDLSTIAQGQSSILQTMESDRQARIATANALKESEIERRTRQEDAWFTPKSLVSVTFGVLGISAAVLTQIGK